MAVKYEDRAWYSVTATLVGIEDQMSQTVTTDMLVDSFDDIHERVEKLAFSMNCTVSGLVATPKAFAGALVRTKEADTAEPGKALVAAGPVGKNEPVPLKTVEDLFIKEFFTRYRNATPKVKWWSEPEEGAS